MVTWKLWRALHHPPLRSPLFRRAYRQQIKRQLPEIHLPLIDHLRVVTLIFAPIVLILFAAPMVVLLYYLALSIAPILLPLANTLYGVLHTHSVCGYIGKEREQQTYDVLCTSPGGALGIHWSYCAGWIHYHNAYRYLLLGVLSIGLVSCLFGLASKAFFGAYSASIFISLSRALSLGLFFVVDYIETIVLSSLTTLIVPLHSINENEARAKAVSLFLALQLAVYLTTALFGSFGLFGAFKLMGINDSLMDFLLPPFTLIFFVTVRELIMTALWRMTEQQLNTNRLELDIATSGVV